MQKFKIIFNVLKYYLSISIYIVFFRNKKNDKWLVGENLGKSCCDNGYYFFKFLKDKNKKNVFFVYDPEACDIDTLKGYEGSLVKINSLKHFILYFQSQYLIFSHGMRDVKPQYIYLRKKGGDKAGIFLQHGIIKFKKVPFNRMSYSKSIIRFVSSTQDEKNIICNELMSRKEQHELNFINYKNKSFELFSETVNLSGTKEDKELLDYVKSYNIDKDFRKNIEHIEGKIGFPDKQVIVTGLPRYDSLIKESEAILKKDKLILLFPTWRDGLSNISNEEFLDSDYFNYYSKLLMDDSLLEMLEVSGFRIELYLHREMKKYNALFEGLQSKSVSICLSDDIRSLVLNSEMLITDYSSIAWEFSILGKEVLFYHFDKEDFEKQRSTYCKDDSDWFGKVCYDSKSLIHSLSESIKTPTKIDKLVVPRDCNERILEEINGIPKKVYFLVYNIYGIGGTVKTVINSANYLYNQGYDVEIISVRRIAQNPALNLEPGIKISPLWDVRANGRLYKKKTRSITTKLFNVFARVTSRFKSRLIHKDEDLYNGFTLFTDFMIVKKLILLNDCNIITTIPSFNTIAPKFTNSTVKVIGQEHKFFKAHTDSMKSKITNSYPSLDLLTVLTDDDSQDYCQLMDADKVRIQPNGTAIGVNHKITKERYKKVVSLARFVPQKRLDLLIDAFKFVVQKDPDCILDIYGDGPLKEELLTQVQELNLENNIFIHDPVTDISSVLLNASIFALSSDFEPFGMVIIEANALGLPVVSFDIPYGPRTIIIDGITGLKAKAFDTQDYADKILSLIDDLDLRNTLSDNAYQHVKDNYSTESVGQGFINLLD